MSSLPASPALQSTAPEHMSAILAKQFDALMASCDATESSSKQPAPHSVPSQFVDKNEAAAITPDTRPMSERLAERLQELSGATATGARPHHGMLLGQLLRHSGTKHTTPPLVQQAPLPPKPPTALQRAVRRLTAELVPGSLHRIEHLQALLHCAKRHNDLVEALKASGWRRRRLEREGAPRHRLWQVPGQPIPASRK